MVGLCDCNNFYASCERVFNPSLIGRPVVVLSNNDGCIVARSNEAKAIGIKMGEPLFKARELILRHNVAVFSSNYQLYGDMSQRVMMTLKELVDSVEVYSIDEAFLDFSNNPIESLQSHGVALCQTVRRNTGIPVSIGIAPTKTLAKVASKLCKKYPKLNGCCLMHRPEDITKVLITYPIEDIWGIGRRYSKMLKECGIHTAEQFRQQSREWVKVRMGIVGVRTWLELHGEPCIELEHTGADRKSICVSRSFAKEYTTIEPLQEAVATFVAMAAEKLRQQKGVAAKMQLFLMTNRFREGSNFFYDNEMITFSTPTDSSLELIEAATKGLRRLVRLGCGYKKAGVVLSEISPNVSTQIGLFDEIDRPKHKALMKTMDALNDRMGRGAVSIAAQGELTHSNSENVSPRCTTQWDEILKVKV